MAESNTPIVVLGIIVLAIIVVGALIIFNIVPIPGVDSPYQIEEGKIVKESQVDLRLIAIPYLASSDVQEVCIESGGIWHNEADFVGCEGYGPMDCATAIATSAMTQCIGAGGNWTCGPEGVYCSI